MAANLGLHRVLQVKQVRPLEFQRVYFGKGGK
jgi:hypothetical protein